MSKHDPKEQLLSVIVPAYKKEKNIRKDLQSILHTLETGLPKQYKYEVICVEDGKMDNTRQEVKKVKSSHLRFYTYDKNEGKGYAVRLGMEHAKGDLISFIDAGMEVSPMGIMMLLAHMEWYDADVIVGSKRHPVSQVNYPLLRKILSFGYHWFVKLAFDLPLRDTQSGLKIFKRKVIVKILPKLLVKRYAMDIEMLAVAKHLGFNRIFEAPIEVKFDKKTSTINWKTIYYMVWDTAAVFYRLRILKYYDK